MGSHDSLLNRCEESADLSKYDANDDRNDDQVSAIRRTGCGAYRSKNRLRVLVIALGLFIAAATRDETIVCSVVVVLNRANK